MKIFYISANNGDGSSSTEFYDSKECIDYLTDDDRCDERYMDGDGGSWGTFECDNFKLPYGQLRTLADIKQDEEDYA